MLQTIVVPLDGSELSESALAVASELARRFDAGLTLMTSGWGSTVSELQAYLDDKGATLDVPALATLVQADTFPASAIADAVAGTEAGIVMATHGRSGLGKALLGSVAEDVLKRTDRPVLLLGPACQAVQPRAGGVLIVPTDGGATSATIVDHAVEWSTAMDLSVRVVTATRRDGTPVGGATGDDLGDRLSAVESRFAQAGLAVQVERLASGGDAAAAIVDLARTLPASMIAMATHGREGFARTALGSTAMKVVHDAPCPVLVHRPAGTS
jgi:nucleotide-binding universal stress UspA family protein